MLRYILAIAISFAAVWTLPACITTTAPDGTVTQQLDIAAAQLALTAAQWAWQEWQESHPADVESDEAAALQARVEALTQVLDSLVALRAQAATEEIAE